MGDVKLNSSGGGSVTLTPPSTASNYTVTLPAATSTLIDTTSTQTLTNKTIASLVTTGTATFGGIVDTGSTGQVQFPATQNPSSNANTLDDYEEGTWTPFDNSGAGLTFSVAAGMYTKVGRLVVATFRVIFPTTTNSLTSSIGGLPFASASVGNQQMQGSAIRYSDCGTVFSLANLQGSSYFFPYTFGGAGLINSNFSGKYIDAAIIYQTS